MKQKKTEFKKMERSSLRYGIAVDNLQLIEVFNEEKKEEEK